MSSAAEAHAQSLIHMKQRGLERPLVSVKLVERLAELLGIPKTAPLGFKVDAELNYLQTVLDGKLKVDLAELKKVAEAQL